MFNIKPTTINTIVEGVQKASERIVSNLDDANKPQQFALGQQQALLLFAAGAGIVLVSQYVQKRLLDADAPGVIVVEDESDKLPD